MVVGVTELIGHVANNPKSYPGPHTVSQERTSRGLQKLDVQRQLSLIWDAVTSRLRELLEAGENVSIQGFGTFTSEAVWFTSKFGPDKVAKRPVFMPSIELKKAVPSWKEKEEVNVDRGAISTAGAVPGKIMFLNEVPIAGGCYYKVDVVRSAVKQLFTAIRDLAVREYSLDLQMGVCRFRAGPGQIKVDFDPKYEQLAGTAKAPYIPKEQKSAQLSETWKKPAFSESMASFIERPKSPEVQAARVATANLNVMSRDMTGCTMGL